jgi:hypothetical protein
MVSLKAIVGSLPKRFAVSLEGQCRAIFPPQEFPIVELNWFDRRIENVHFQS